MDYAIILGGGKGLRMGSDVPKQFIEIGGLPILMRSIIGNISVRYIISPRTTK